MLVHHLALRTDDIPRLERFYTGVVGLGGLRRQAAGSVWLEAGGTIVMIEARAAGEPRVDGRAMDLTCFAIAPEGLEDFLRRLHAADVRIEGRTACTIYVRDPDGRRVGLSSYPIPLGDVCSGT